MKNKCIHLQCACFSYRKHWISFATYPNRYICRMTFRPLSHNCVCLSIFHLTLVLPLYNRSCVHSDFPLYLFVIPKRNVSRQHASSPLEIILVIYSEADGSPWDSSNRSNITLHLLGDTWCHKLISKFLLSVTSLHPRKECYTFLSFLVIPRLCI